MRATAYVGTLAGGIGLLVGNYVAWAAFEFGSSVPTLVGAVAAVVSAGIALGALAKIARETPGQASGDTLE